MRKDQFIIHATIEDEHWWFVSRREILISHIARFKPEARIIAEIGCGTGGNLKALAERGYTVIGTDINPLAIELAQNRVPGEIYLGNYIDTLENHWNDIDVVILADVLEHLEDDKKFLTTLSEHVRPGTLIVITVPAMSILWSQHDLILGHHRRYNDRDFQKLIESQSSTSCLFKSYMNSVLFPPILLFRLINKILPQNNRQQTSDLRMPPKPLNSLLRKLFSFEQFWFNKNRTFTFGVSLLAILKKDEGK